MRQTVSGEELLCLFYTRVTGIWQTVWMEALSPCGLKSANTYPDINNNQLIITPEFYQISNDQTLEVTIYDSEKKSLK